MKKYREKLDIMLNIALEGEVATLVSTSNHNAEIIYRIFTRMKDMPPSVQEVAFGCFKSFTSFEPDMYDRIKAELGMPDYPMWIWRDCCISDIKVATSILTKTIESNKTEIDIKEASKAIVRSSFTKFLYKVYTVNKGGAKALCDSILSDDELDFLHSVCFIMNDNIINHVDEDDEITDEEIAEEEATVKALYDLSFDVRDILSFLEGVYRAGTIEEEVVANDNITNNVIGKDIIVASSKEFRSLGELTNYLQGLLNKMEKSEDGNSGYKYVVKKRYKGSTKVVTLCTFNNYNDASSYIDEILSEFPDLCNTCDFIIEESVA